MTDENLYAAPEADVDVDPNPSGELAGRGARLVGAIVDTIVLILLIFPIQYLTGAFDTPLEEPPDLSTVFFDTIVSQIVLFVLFMAVNGYLLAKRGQSVGKVVAKTRIVSVKDGGILPLQTIIGLRYLPLWIVSAIPFIGPLVGLIDSLFVFRDDRRCIHDLIAGTRVVVA